MIRKIYSELVFDGHQIRSKLGITLNDQGKILEVKEKGQYNESEYAYYPGLLTPGFINAHCHLELSHLRGKFNSGSGLIPFLKSVVSNRNYEEREILDAIEQADHEMWTEGIVAVGDISNKTDSLNCKIKSKINYYNFIECFDFLQNDSSNKFLEPYLEVYKKFGGLTKSLSPHAPYSVSSNLFKEINTINDPSKVISIHNQEVKDENDLFINKSGGIEDFYKPFGFSLDKFNPIGKNSIHYTISQLSPQYQTLLIHNTCMTEEDIEYALSWNKNIYFVTCPNANLFIENSLPNYSNFINKKINMCIGTDSLSSNWQLSILEEIKTILKYCSTISLELALKWASLNGAKALKMEEGLGSIEIEKCPGINWIQDIHQISDKFVLGKSACVKKLI